MGRKVFVPLTDEILYDHPELINGPVLPYTAGQACHHWLSVELNPEEGPAKSARVAPARSSPLSQWLSDLRLPTLESLAR